MSSQQREQASLAYRGASHQSAKGQSAVEATGGLETACLLCA